MASNTRSSRALVSKATAFMPEGTPICCRRRPRQQLNLQPSSAFPKLAFSNDLGRNQFPVGAQRGKTPWPFSASLGRQVPNQSLHQSLSRPLFRRNFSTISFFPSGTRLWMQDEGNLSATGSTTNEKRLMFLQNELVRLAGGKSDFNANSPAQRSMAIFGEVRSCTKQILCQIIAQDESVEYGRLSPDKRLLASYILEFQELSKVQKQQQQQPTNKERDDVAETKASSILQLNKHEQSSKPLSDGVGSENISPATRNGGQRRPPRERPLTYEEIIEGLFTGPPGTNKLDSYWKEPLLELSRPVARDLARQLDPKLCPMGYDPDQTPGITLKKPSNSSGPTRGKRVGFLGFCRDQKEIYPRHVILVRCGDFYETFGVDAMLLVEHVGLNPMGGKVRSGCPKQNIQATLDGLTGQGFSVAVYEEVEPVYSTKGKTKLKERTLAQIVSPASPTYLYNNWLLGGANGGSADASDPSLSLDGLPPPRPCVGIVHTAAGYTIVELSLEERSVRYSERLTSEAVACRLEAYPPADPLVYIPSPSEQESSTITPSFFSKNRGRKSRSRMRTKILSPHLVPEPTPGKSDADRYIRAIVNTILQLNEGHNINVEEEEKGKISSQLFEGVDALSSVKDFTVTMGSTSTNPLYVETATQIGLMDDKTIPSLIRHVLDDAAPAPTRRFLHRYLLIPPPPIVAQSMASVVRTLIDPDTSISLPPLTVPNLGKALILIRAGQAGANVYGELLQSLDSTKYILEQADSTIARSNEQDQERMDDFVEALLRMCSHESGLPAERLSLLNRCRKAIDAIEAVVSSSFHVEEDYLGESNRDFVSQDEFIPIEFFERNEKTWRGRVQPSVARDAYQRVQVAAERLSQAVREDFIGSVDSNRNLLKYNFFDNLISLQKVPTEGLKEGVDFRHPNDRFGKVLSNRWTTEKVKKAVSFYVSECEYATLEVASILSMLAQNLQEDGHIPAIVQSSHFNLVLSTAFHHAIKATNSKWQLAKTIEDANTSEAHFVDVFPYWMHKSKAVANTFDLTSMILLTAPNMSGKSTIMRSTAAAALLTICGLCAPLSSESMISRFDTLFLRGASADVPTEDKSAFGAEMGDLAALFRCSSEKSFVFVDELGRGTSPRDGTRLAGAVLERMAESGMSGIFATHLHDVLDLPLKKDRIVTKRIQIDRDEENDTYQWTHKLEDGMCKDSMALVTAKRFGLPDDIILRAKELTSFVPQQSSGMPIGTREIADARDSHVAPTSMRGEDSASKTAFNTIVDAEAQLQKFKTTCQQEFLEVINLASQLVVESNTTGIEIPARHSPPAFLANRSCLYILQLVPPFSTDSDTTSAKYYVGETDSIGKRLTQHRKKGDLWGRSKAVVFPLGDKSQARYLESALIGELARAGYAMESIADGRTLRHFRD